MQHDSLSYSRAGCNEEKMILTIVWANCGKHDYRVFGKLDLAKAGYNESQLDVIVFVIYDTARGHAGIFGCISARELFLISRPCKARRSQVREAKLWFFST